MGNRRIAKTENSTITQGAITLGIICGFFVLFRGVTNIFNAFLVPISLYVYLKGKKKRDIWVMYLLVIIFCGIFFNMQLIFITFYCGISLLLNILNQKNLNKMLSVLILSIVVSLSFWIAIILTDFLFLTHINEIMITILNGNILVYSMILYIEGLVIGTSLLFMSRRLNKLLPQ